MSAELEEPYQVFSPMPRGQNSFRLKENHDLKESRLAPTVLLLSDDEALTDFVGRVVKRPWKVIRRGADKYGSREVFTQPNVRLVILDDQAVVETERGWLLAQIRRHFSGTSLLYVAASQSDGNEKRARANGAHYYASKPLSLERFGYVLRSFLQAQQVKDEVYDKCCT
jgi:DNA-binding response OmpR family regulator